MPFAPSTGRRRGATAGRGAPTAPLKFADDEKSIEFGAGGVMYHCNLADYTCTKGGPIPPPAFGRGGAPDDVNLPNPAEIGSDPVDGLEYQPPAPQDDAAYSSFARRQRPCAPAPRAGSPLTQSRAGRGGRPSIGGPMGSAVPQDAPETCLSFDGKWEALIQNFNVYLKQAGGSEPAVPLSRWLRGNYYTLRSIAWSPDSKKLAADHTRPGYDRQVHYVESSPADQLQPKHSSISIRSPATPSISPILPFLTSPPAAKSRSIRPSSPTPTTSLRPSGGKTAAPSP